MTASVGYCSVAVLKFKLAKIGVLDCNLSIKFHEEGRRGGGRVNNEIFNGNRAKPAFRVSNAHESENKNQCACRL